MTKLINKIRRSRGFALVMGLITILVTLSYGLYSFKGSLLVSERAIMNNQVINALNRASDAAPFPTSMFIAACNYFATFFNLPAVKCEDATNYTDDSETFSGISTLRGDKTCNIKMDFTPETTTTSPTFCVSIEGCNDIGSIIPPIISPARYAAGASGCISSKTKLVHLLIDHSSALAKIWRPNEENASGPSEFPSVPPSFLLLPEAGYAQFDLDCAWGSGLGPPACDSPSKDIVAGIRRSQPPGVYEGSYYYGSVTGEIPAGRPYRAPFSTQEIDGTTGAYDNDDRCIGDVACNSQSVYKNSLPQVAYAPAAAGSSSTSPTTGFDSLPDPIHSIPLIFANDWMWRWAYASIQIPDINKTDAVPVTGSSTCNNSTASNVDCNFKRREGHLTSWELTNLCFGHFKLLFDRTAQEILYMLNAAKIETAFSLFSSAVKPLRPFKTESMRVNPASQFSPFNLTSTTTDPLDLPLLGPNPSGAWGVAVGDLIEDQFGDSGQPWSLTRSRALDIIHPNQLCAREMRHTVDDFYQAGTKHFFTSLPDAWENDRSVVINNAVDSNPSTNFLSCPGGANVPTQPAVESGAASPTACFSNFGLAWGNTGKCRGTTYPNCSGSIAMDNQYDHFPYSMCNTSNPTGQYGLTPYSGAWSAGTIQHPYRWCKTDESRWPGAWNAIVADRVGVPTKSGYPIHLGFALPTDPAASREARYFTTVADGSSVYPWTVDVFRENPSYDSTGITNANEAQTYTADAATPVALWAAIQSLTSTQVVGSNPSKYSRIIVLLSTGTPSASMQECLQGKLQCMVTSKRPPAGLIPTFTDQVLTGGYNYTIALQETLWMLHYAKGLGLKPVVLNIVADRLGEPDIKAGFNAGLKKPLANNGAASAPLFNFCKPAGVTATLPGEIAPPAGTPACDPNLDPDDIPVINVSRDIGESYAVFTRKVVFAVTSFVKDQVMGWQLSK